MLLLRKHASRSHTSGHQAEQDASFLCMHYVITLSRSSIESAGKCVGTAVGEADSPNVNFADSPIWECEVGKMPYMHIKNSSQRCKLHICGPLPVQGKDVADMMLEQQ